MATKRRRTRTDGSAYWQVRYRLHGVESSTSLDDEHDAEVFRELIDRVGAAKALQIHGIDQARNTGPTVANWLAHHIDHLSGIERRTRHEYLGILKNDITPHLGPVPLASLSRDDISRWVEVLRDAGASGKTIANKHGLLSAALNGAVRAGHISANPAAGIRLPRTERQEMRFLSHEEFATLLAEVTEPWRPMVRFLVASGARPAEVMALRPADINRTDHTVRISRAWKRGPGGYQIGAPKTDRGIRTINVPAAVLNELDYTGEWLFTNPGRGRRAQGGPVRLPNFRANVWWPAVERAKLAPPSPRVYDLRHTCASWMIQAGVPLPVIQQHLGHESIEVTVGVYGHLDRRSAQAAADAIAVALG